MKNYFITITLICCFFGCNDPNEGSDAFGNFEAETVLISAEQPGTLLEARYSDGTNVTSHETLAIADTSQLVLQLLQLDAQKAAIASQKASVRSQVEILKEQQSNLRINERRIQNMLQDGAATKKQLDDIQGEIRVIEKQIESTNTMYSAIDTELQVIQAQKEVVLDQLHRCAIRTPISGTILEKYVETGEYVTPGKNLYKLADLSTLDLKVFVSGAQLGEIAIGQKVKVLVDENRSDYKVLEGKVTWISSEAEFTPKIIQTKEERVKLVYAVRVKVKNDGFLKIGMPGEVRWESGSNSSS